MCKMLMPRRMGILKTVDLADFAEKNAKRIRIRKTVGQRRKNTANLQTWFGGRFWPKFEEGFVVKNKILLC